MKHNDIFLWVHELPTAMSELNSVIKYVDDLALLYFYTNSS